MVFDNPDINAVLLATPHSLHAGQTARALNAGKHVFVEKPLSLTREGLREIVAAAHSSPAFFQVGFNRRFAPLSLAAKAHLATLPGRRHILLRVNAGRLPDESWQRDADEGHGRILGEACHFIDLGAFLAGAPIVSVHAEAAAAGRRPVRGRDDHLRAGGRKPRHRVLYRARRHRLRQGADRSLRGEQRDPDRGLPAAGHRRERPHSEEKATKRAGQGASRRVAGVRGGGHRRRPAAGRGDAASSTPASRRSRRWSRWGGARGSSWSRLEGGTLPENGPASASQAGGVPDPPPAAAQPARPGPRPRPEGRCLRRSGPTGRAHPPARATPPTTPPTCSRGSFTFLNRAEVIGFPPHWNVTAPPRLWLYHLHYHDFLQQLPFQPAREVVLDWIARHRPGPDRVGWEPYPVARRIVNWCARFIGGDRSRTLADDTLRDTLWASLCEQAEHLRRRLEWHLLGNHLLENAVALSLSGSCFGHPAARRWLTAGQALLARELPEQILADGGHVERSPMYQSRVLDALLLLDATGDRALRALVRPRLPHLADSLARMTHPDGGIALLNDSAFGVYPPPLELVRRPGRNRRERGRSPSARPVTTAHAPPGATTSSATRDRSDRTTSPDTATRTCSPSSCRCADRGWWWTAGFPPTRPARCATTAARRARTTRSRSTAGTRRSWWAAFRVGRRPRPEEVHWSTSDGGFRLSGRHAGYRQLPGGPIHARTFRWRREGKLEIRDRVEAARPVRSVARLHFHPECRLDDVGGEGCALNFPGGRARIRWSGWETVARDAGSFYCPEFGVARPNPCLALSSTAARLDGTIDIQPR